MKIRTLLAAAVLAALSQQSAASDTPVTADVITGWTTAEGTRMTALRLTLAPGWKTYWRAPGDAGIPPSFDWSGSRNLSSVAIIWPTPRVFDQNGLRTVGYEDTLIIPLKIEPSASDAPVRLSVHMELGICSDICIPQELRFEATIGSDSTRPTPAIAAALAQQPYSAREAGVSAVICSVTPTSDGLRIETRLTMPSTGSPEHIVIEPGSSDIWVSEAQSVRRGGELVAVSDLVHVNGGPIALDRSDIRITVIGSNYAVDVHGCKPA